jgi:hypothetical protein
MARVWNDYANHAIYLLYPRARDGVDYRWSRLVGTDPSSLLFDNTGYPINLTDVQSVATWLMTCDPYSGNGTFSLPLPPPPAWPGTETDVPGGGGGTPTPPVVVPGTPISFYAATAPISGAPASDTTTYTMGANIEPLAPGKIKAVRWYQAHANSAPNGKVAVWHRNGTLLKSATFTGMTGVGWKSVDIDCPINQCGTYKVGIWMQLGSDSLVHYWAVANQFASVPKYINDGTRNVLKMPAGTGANSRGYPSENNVFASPSVSDITFPDSDFNDGGYAVDVEYVTLIPAEPPLPTSPPMTWNDARFASNTAADGCGYQAPYFDPIVFQNVDFINMTSGESLVANIANAKFINCRFRGSEGPRIAAAGLYEYYGCYFEVGSINPGDHADAIQVFASGAAPTVKIIGCTIRMTDANGIGNNAGAFFSDNGRAIITIQHCNFDGYGGSNGGLRIDNMPGSLGCTKLDISDTVLYGRTFNGVAAEWNGVITTWTGVTDGATGAAIPNPFP